MAPEIVLRKLSTLRRLVEDLSTHERDTLDQVRNNHYRIERILELLATAGADLLQHLLSEREIVASTYRDVFLEAAKNDLIEPELAESLARAAGLRNVLVHIYDEIDLEILHRSIPTALRDFARLIERIEPFSRSEE